MRFRGWWLAKGCLAIRRSLLPWLPWRFLAHAPSRSPHRRRLPRPHSRLPHRRQHRFHPRGADRRNPLRNISPSIPAAPIRDAQVERARGAQARRLRVRNHVSSAACPIQRRAAEDAFRVPWKPERRREALRSSPENKLTLREHPATGRNARNGRRWRQAGPTPRRRSSGSAQAVRFTA